MPVYAALLRAVNVGGTGKLPMADLRAMCADVGFERVSTYIASGNVVFATDMTEHEIVATLEARLAEYARKQVGVLVRDAEEMRRILRENPFSEVPGNRANVIFLDAAPPVDTLENLRHVVDERVVLGEREIYVAYGEAGMGRSKLQIPALGKGTARNLNTVAKLTAMLASLEQPE